MPIEQAVHPSLQEGSQGLEEDRDQARCHKRDPQIVTAMKECAQVSHHQDVQANHTDRQDAIDQRAIDDAINVKETRA